MKNILVVSASSDIGCAVVKNYYKDNFITATYRSKNDNILSVAENENTRIAYLDLEYDYSIEKFSETMGEWDLCFCCVGEPLPIGPFFDTDFSEWQKSVAVNSILQLKLIHKIKDRASKDASVVFFGSGGTNKSIKDFSAYTIGKTILCKAAELIAEENPSMRVFVFGPGWVYSKMHERIYNKLTHSKEWKDKTKEIVERGMSQNEYGDLLSKIDTILNLPPELVSGKNFCITDDVDEIQAGKDLYKFRRLT